MPHEEQITVEKFLEILEASPGKGKLVIFLSEIDLLCEATTLSPTRILSS